MRPSTDENTSGEARFVAAGPPIPTWYDGAHFRSRTEARYAVFFNQLGIKWDYEVQGFDADGTWYLPDFLTFPALGMLWVEVKGSWEQDPAGVARSKRFSLWRPQPSRLAIVAGLPAEGNPALTFGGDEDAGNPGNGTWDTDDQEWRPCPSGHHFDLTYPGTFRAKFAEDGCPYTDQEGIGQRRLDRAIIAARSARFDGKPPASGEAA